jgi:Pentapeptide repeats (8 copies)
VLAAVATFVASLGALYYNGKSSRQATQQARLSERAQTSERFSRSVDELGSPSVTVRAGAVYAFGGLMRDGNRDDHAIVDILNSFVRLRSSRSTAVRPASTQAPADIAAALIVLRHHQMALAQTNLSGFDLRGADLTGADLTGANLTGTDLTGADLRDTLLIGARLRGAHLEGAYLDGSHLNDSRLEHAHLSDSDLTGVSLAGADLAGADLRGATLTGADLTSATLTRADVERADLSAAMLTGAQLGGVKHSADATFRGAFCGFSPSTACRDAVSPDSR